MPGNYVEILVKSQDRAKPDLDALKAKLDELSHTTADARAEVDDADAAAKLDDLRAKLLRLSGQVASPKVSLSGAVRAEAQIHAIEASLDKLGSDSGGTGKLGRLDQKMKEAGRDSEETKGRVGALGQAFNEMTLGLPRGVGEMGMFGKAMAGLNIATGLGEPLMAGLTVAVGGLSSGLVSAGMGAGVFGLAAKGVISRVEAADKANTKLTGSLGQVQSGLKNATSQWNGFIKSASPGVSSVIAQGLQLIPKALSLMKPFLAPVETALHSIISEVKTGLSSSGMQSFISTMAKASGPMLKDLTNAIFNIVKGLGGILKTFMPVAHDIMGGLDKITAKFAKWGESLSGHSGFQDLMNMFRQDTPLVESDLRKLVVLIKDVVSNMAGMSTFSNSKMLLQALGPILTIMTKLTKIPGLVDLILYLKLATNAGKKLKLAFTGLQAGVGIMKSVAGAASGIRAGFSDAETAASDASGMWGTFGGKISAAITAIRGWGIWSKIASAATKVWTGVQAAFDAVMDANPIMLIVIAIGLLVAAIVICTVKFKSFRDFWKDAWKVIQGSAVAAWHFIDNGLIHPLMRGIDDLVNFVKSHWKILATILATVLLGPIAGIVVYVATHWAQIKALTARLVDDVRGILDWFERLPGMFRRWWDDAVGAVEGGMSRMISFVRELPGKILGALESLPGKLFSLGAHIISMLASGIKSAIGDVTGAIGSIAGEITSHLPFSPAKKGPLSGAGDPTRSGRKISQMLAQGMTAGKSAVSSAAATVAGAAAIGAGGYGAAGSGGGGRLELTVRAEGADSQLMTVLLKSLRLEVRRTGGGGPNSVQRALGRVT